MGSLHSGKIEDGIVEAKSTRYNEGKLKWSLVHYKSLEPMIRVLMFGKGKYGLDNWKIGLDPKETLESMQRHLASIMDGEEVDIESGIDHVGHLMCNCMMYIYHKNKQNEK